MRIDLLGNRISVRGEVNHSFYFDNTQFVIRGGNTFLFSFDSPFVSD